MKKIILFITTTCICISLVGCKKSSSVISNGAFNENKAISMVIKDHADFPLNQTDVIIKKIPTGGYYGAIANVKFSTKLEKISESNYVVTLIKDRHISVNGIHVKSY